MSTCTRAALCSACNATNATTTTASPCQVACIGLFIWAAVVLASIGAHPSRIVVRFFDMITIAVPPALPACLTISTVFSIGRLRQRGIYVTGPHTITLAGQLDVVAFDKTGAGPRAHGGNLAWLQP